MLWYKTAMTTTSGRTPVGERLPTLEDVARLAGVSRATVSRVINGIRNVDPHLHEVVWNAVGQTGYVPNRLARSLVTRRTGTVALVVSDSESHDDDPFMGRFFADPYFGRVVGGLMSVLRQAGVQLALQMVGTDEQRTRLVGDLRHGQADGVIVLSLPAHDPLPRMLTDAGVPAVMIGRPAEPVPINYVDLANDTGASLAADHLVGRGCQLIGMISGPADVPASNDRISGFRRSMARRGHGWIPLISGNFTQESGEQAMRALLAEQPGPGRRLRRQRPDGAGRADRAARGRPPGPVRRGGGRLRRQQRGPGGQSGPDHGPASAGGHGRGERPAPAVQGGRRRRCGCPR